MKTHFQNKSFFSYIVSEFKNRKESKNPIDYIKAFLSLYIRVIPNYYTQKNWNLKFVSIQNDIINFYPNLEVQFEGETPSIKTQILNTDSERITFLFDKTHIAVTSHALHFFPFSSPNKNFIYKGLEENFKLNFKHNDLSRRTQFDHNLSLITIEYSNQKTIMTPDVKALNDQVKIIVNQIIAL